MELLSPDVGGAGGAIRHLVVSISQKEWEDEPTNPLRRREAGLSASCGDKYNTCHYQ